MKVIIEIDTSLDNMEVHIKAPEFSSEITEIKNTIEKAISSSPNITFYKENTEYFISLKEILFFDTDMNKVYAHTKNDFFEVKFKLYELEEIIPNYFFRASKSTIINLKLILSLEKSFSGSSSASFINSNKKTHISRHYYKILKEKLKETR
ncbi:DNA-binding protein [Gemella sp. oral taxon 928]|uniref:LytTR family DNA-binding domain-containing protein n=1 Tax=Gemella sp. oral taxon 928 TaxID=1785995 RepID=UPI0007682ED9|nr:LytTR family DNA-binding domain-containing protein [Gemella sp. oral taxon 928]AME09892.1 DNA-binding protein [Gemella sp. oral taxon 928]